MTEVTCAGIDHSYTAFIGSCYDLIVTHTAARLNDASSACVYNDVKAIAEWEECVASHG
jgi:hypothetical protein